MSSLTVTLRVASLALLPLVASCASGVQRAETRSEPIRQRAAELVSFVRAGWHMPLRVRVYLSDSQADAPLAPAELADQEALALEQLDQVQLAYANTAFDFFAVDLWVSRGSFPRARYEGAQARLEIRLDAGGTVFSAEELMAALAQDYRWKRGGRWYEDERPEELRAALRRDLGKLQQLEDELALSCRRLELLRGTLRARRRDGEVILSPSEADYARSAQFRATLALNRVLNTLGRWRLASEDSGVEVQREALAVAYYARLLEQVYLDWLLEVVVGGRSKLKVWRKDWWGRNLLYKALDSEAPRLAVDGRELPGALASGSIRSLLELRLDHDLKDQFERLDRQWEERAPAPPGGPLEAAIQPVTNRMAAVRRLGKDRDFGGFTAWKELWDARTKDAVSLPFYWLVASIARFLGDTRTSHPRPAVTDAQLEDLERKLRPGDIILVRQDRYLSNAFLPGFWPHAILYLGAEAEWTSLELAGGEPLADDPIVHAVIEDYRRKLDGQPARVIEAISEGVVFNSLPLAVQKDYVAVLRPDLPEQAIAAGIRRALRFLDRPYDFSFDFATDDRIVCTELIYRAYESDLNFGAGSREPEESRTVPGLLEIMGRQTMPANELARLAVFMQSHPEPRPEIGYPGRKLRLIHLLYRAEAEGAAEALEGQAAIQRFRASVDR